MGGLVVSDVNKSLQYKQEAETKGFRTRSYKCKYLDIAHTQKFSELFNLGDLEHDYLLYAPLSSHTTIQKLIQKLAKQCISDYLNFDYTNPDGEENLFITGLILGYPIETTASRLWY
jgi:hypothetical protein